MLAPAVLRATDTWAAKVPTLHTCHSPHVLRYSARLSSCWIAHCCCSPQPSCPSFNILAHLERVAFSMPRLHNRPTAYPPSALPLPQLQHPGTPGACGCQHSQAALTDVLHTPLPPLPCPSYNIWHTWNECPKLCPDCALTHPLPPQLQHLAHLERGAHGRI